MNNDPIGFITLLFIGIVVLLVIACVKLSDIHKELKFMNDLHQPPAEPSNPNDHGGPYSL